MQYTTVNLMRDLQDLGIHTLTIRTSKVETKEALSMEANQSINYQNATFKQYGTDASAMFGEIIRRATVFREMTKTRFNPSLEE
jgi:hypothetical protein